MASELTTLFSKRLNALLTFHGIDPSPNKRAIELGSVCGLTRQAARKWLDGKGFPGTEELVLIASSYGTTVSWLLGETGDDSVETSGVLCKCLGTRLITSTCDLFGGAIKNGDQVIVSADYNELKDGAIYCLKTPSGCVFRRVWLEASGEVTVSADETQNTVVPMQEFKSAILGEVTGVVRKL